MIFVPHSCKQNKSVSRFLPLQEIDRTINTWGRRRRGNCWLIFCAINGSRHWRAPRARQLPKWDRWCWKCSTYDPCAAVCAGILPCRPPAASCRLRTPAADGICRTVNLSGPSQSKNSLTPSPNSRPRHQERSYMHEKTLCFSYSMDGFSY